MEIPWSVGPATVAAFIAFIGILIFVHELGHFLAAKFFDIKVVKFSLGFGPQLVAFRWGETVYQIALVPLGGFVKMVGDNPSDAVDPDDMDRSFTAAPVYQRALVALAGPAFNLFFPIVCFFAYNVLGPSVVSPLVGQIELNQPADKAGLRSGDRIISVDGYRTYSFGRITELISARPNEIVPIEVDRDGERLQLRVTPSETVATDLFGKPKQRGIIGVSWNRPGTRVGVAFPAQNHAGFLTGDRIVRVAGRPVSAFSDVDRAFRTFAGTQVEIRVARPQPKVAGGLLFADHEVPVDLSVSIPQGATGAAALGLAPSEGFIRRIVPGGPADRAGLAPGDQIIEVSGRRIRLFWSFLLEARKSGGDPVSLTVRRAGARVPLTLMASKVTCTNEVTKKPVEIWDLGLGIGMTDQADCSEVNRKQQLYAQWDSVVPPSTEEARLTLSEALESALRETGNVIGLVATAIFKLFSTEVPIDNVAGPLRLFKLAAQAAEVGVFAYLRMLALISVNLGLINLLPIPIFDGGHLLFCLVEAVKRRPLSLRAREYATLVGLVILAALVLLALRNDLQELGIF